MNKDYKAGSTRKKQKKQKNDKSDEHKSMDIMYIYLYIVSLQSMFSMDPANLTTAFHDKSMAFAQDTFAALEKTGFPFFEVS